MKRLITFISLLVLSNTVFAVQNSPLDYLGQVLGVGNSFSALKDGFSVLFLEMQISVAVVLMALISAAIIITSLSMILRFVGYDPLESFKRGELVEFGSDQVGIYVQTEDGFISEQENLSNEFVRKCLDSETTTMVSFSNDRFDAFFNKEEKLADDNVQKAAEDFLTADFDQWRQADHYDDDVWSGCSSSSIMGTPERYVSMNEGFDDNIPDSLDDLLERSEREYD
jgi:hypothetical protein